MIKKLAFFLLIVLLGVINAFAQTNLVINEFLASNLNCHADEAGDYDDWIEIYNPTTVPVDLAGFFITDDLNNLTRWKIPEGHSNLTTVSAGGYLIFWADDQPEQGPRHPGFKLSDVGEQIALVGKSGTYIIDAIRVNSQTTDISMARYPDGGSTWRYYDKPTPSMPNTKGYAGITLAPVFSHDGSIFYGNKTIALSQNDPDSKIHFTLDGADPSESSNLYSTPITFDTTTMIRARSFKQDYLPGSIITNSYVNDSTHLPILSIVTDPKNLWSDSIGIYVNYNKEGMEWERPVHNQYFKNNQLQFSINSGIRIQGSTSRGMRKKSFRLFFRSGYDQERLEYDMFATAAVQTFKNLVLRAGYDEDLTTSHGTLLRDPLVSELWCRAGQLTSLGNFAILYLNGSFWGIYNIRESINEYFVQDHLHYQNFDLVRYLKYKIELKYGSLDDWYDLVNFFENNDFTNDLVYQEAKDRIDIENFTTLQALVHCAEYFSWGYGVYAMKERRSGAKWHWTIWDLDRAYTNVSRNEFDMYHKTTDFYWYNIMINRLLQNANYKNYFINRIADLLNTVFRPENATRVIDSLVAVVEDDIPAEAKRWDSSINKWHANIQNLRNFANNRPQVVRNQMKNYFKLGNQYKLEVNVAETGGAIQVNSLQIKSFPWQGIYFEGNPITIRALSRPGYRFVGWSNPGLSDRCEIHISLNKDTPVTAIFEKEITGDHFDLIAPAKMTRGEKLPVVVRLINNNQINPNVTRELVLAVRNAVSDTIVKLKKGVGTINTQIMADNTFELYVKDDQFQSKKRQIIVKATLPVQFYQGQLPGGVTTWDSTCDRRIMAGLTIPENSQLVLEPGTRVLLDAGVNVMVYGKLDVNGTREAPVLFISTSPAEPWGGFEFYGTQVQMNYCFWINGGGDSEKAWKHCKEFGIQPILFAKDDTQLFLDNVFILFSPKGKAIGSEYSRVRVNQSVIANVFHGGEFWYSLLHYQNTHVMNIPNDDRVYFQDEDNDGMHIDMEYPGPEKLSTIENCYFLSGKDDAIDHQNAYLQVKNTWLEDWIHEGVAASNEGTPITGRNSVSLYNVIAMNCDHGFEAGHGSPRIIMDHCVAVANNEGLRFGDNYSSLSTGHVTITNSIFYNNVDNIKNFVKDLQGPRPGAIEISFSMTNDPDYDHYPDCITGVPLFDQQYHLLAESAGAGMGTDGTNLGLVDTMILPTGSIVINEIMYRPSDDFDSKDWIELFNPQAITQNAGGWILKDNNAENSFTLPAGITIAPNSYLAICGDTLAFTRIYPGIKNYLGNFNFGYGQGDQVRLYAATGELVDSVAYEAAFPWPTTPNGTGPSLELIDFTRPNTPADNWAASKAIGGTPGKTNGITLETEEPKPTMPTSVVLKQNYPNPFNKQTVLEYDLPVLAKVTLTIYNILGRQVAVLVDNFWQKPGTYRVNFTTTGMAGGLYFYRLTTYSQQNGSQIFTRKMLYLE